MELAAERGGHASVTWMSCHGEGLMTVVSRIAIGGIGIEWIGDQLDGSLIVLD